MLALEASGCNRAEVVHKPRLLADNGSSYIAGNLADWLEDQGMDHVRGAPNHPHRPEQDRALARPRSDPEEPHPARKLLPAGRPGSAGRRLRGALQSPALPREPWQPHARRRLLRTGQGHHQTKEEHQETNHRKATTGAPAPRSLTSIRESQSLRYETNPIGPFNLTTDSACGSWRHMDMDRTGQRQQADRVLAGRWSRQRICN